MKTLATIRTTSQHIAISALWVLFSQVSYAQVLKIGAEDDAAPWSYANGTGYVNSLVKAAFEAVGQQVQYQVMPYARCKLMAVSGQIVACFSMSKTPELSNRLLYPKVPVFQAHNLLISRADAPWSGCDSARWSSPPTIGLVRGYEYLPTVENLVKNGQANVDMTESEVSNLRKIQAGRIDAGMFTVDEVKRFELLQKQANVAARMKTVCDFGAMPAFIAFSASHPQGKAALTAFEEGYAKLNRTGTIAELQRSWQKRALSEEAFKPH